MSFIVGVQPVQHGGKLIVAIYEKLCSTLDFAKWCIQLNKNFSMFYEYIHHFLYEKIRVFIFRY